MDDRLISEIRHHRASHHLPFTSVRGFCPRNNWFQIAEHEIPLFGNTIVSIEILKMGI